MREAADTFAQEATLFRRWAEMELNDVEASTAGLALLRVTRLYLAALSLPGPPTEFTLANSRERVGDAEWQLVYRSAGLLPLDYYGALPDPLAVPPGEPTIGSLSDDIADMYRDVVSGLREYEAGRYSEAMAAWAFDFRHHWGTHATGAMYALHAWLTRNPQSDTTCLQTG